jgi:hypothetical protein
MVQPLLDRIKKTVLAPLDKPLPQFLHFSKLSFLAST